MALTKLETNRTKKVCRY